MGKRGKRDCFRLQGNQKILLCFQCGLTKAIQQPIKIAEILQSSGYVYLKTIPKETRDMTIADVKMQMGYVVDSFMEMVQTLPWFTQDSKQAALTKCELGCMLIIKHILSNLGLHTPVFSESATRINSMTYKKLFPILRFPQFVIIFHLTFCRIHSCASFCVSRAHRITKLFG